MPKNEIYKVFISLSFCFFTTDVPALAGGDSWKVKIENLQTHSSSSATVIFQILSESNSPSGYPFDFSINCPKMLVNIEYNPEIKSLQTWSKNLTKQKHQLALASLKTAYENASLTRFGVIGSGLALSKNGEKITLGTKIPTKCKFDSRGIEILIEYKNRPVVYSFNGKI